MQALIVEDDARLASALERILSENSYAVDVVHDGQSGFDYASSGIYDVIILDVMMPRKNGFEVVGELRRAGLDTPVLMLTARDSVPDKIVGYDSGADDYMTKPFAPAELLAHLRALTRRKGQLIFERIEAGDLSLDIESRTLSCKARSIPLSFKEFELARIFLSNPGQIVTKDALLSKVWGVDSNAVDNNVEAYISFLRKKMRFLGSTVSIDTIRKVGYRANVGGDDAQTA